MYIMGPKRIDISGQKFGMLTAIKWICSEKRIVKKTGKIIFSSLWQFKCECGNLKVLRKGRVTPICKTSIKSCGCLKGIRNRELKTRGYKGISGSQWYHIVRAAKVRNLEFNLSLKEAWEVFEKQDGICALSGDKLIFSKIRPWYKITTASLDRINSDFGYTKDNIQWIHKNLNIMKWDLDQEKFIEWCTKVHTFRIEKGTK